MDEIMEPKPVQQVEEIAENEEKCCGSCEAVLQVKNELAGLAAENERLKEELEQMKKLPKFSTKTVADKNGMEAVRSIFRKR